MVKSDFTITMSPTDIGLSFFSTDHLVTERLCAYSIDSERSYSHRLELRPSKCRVSSQIVLFAIQQLLHLMILLCCDFLRFFFVCRGPRRLISFSFLRSALLVREMTERIPLTQWESPFFHDSLHLVAQVYSFIFMKHSPWQIVNIEAWT